MESHLPENHVNNRYYDDVKLSAWKQKSCNDYCTVKHTLDTFPLGYTYDNLFQIDLDTHKVKPSVPNRYYIKFNQVNPNKLKPGSYELHVFILDKIEQEIWDPMKSLPLMITEWNKIPGYVGYIRMDCNELTVCLPIKPFDSFMECTKQLESKRLAPNTAYIRGVFISNNVLLPINMEHVMISSPEIIDSTSYQTSSLYDDFVSYLQKQFNFVW